MIIQGYKCIIERGTRGFVAAFPQLPGLRAFGVDREQVEIMAEQIITEYLSDSTEHFDLDASAESPSIQSKVLDAVVAKLGGNEGSAWRCRFTPFSVLELPAENVLPETETAEYDDGTGTDNKFRFIIRHTAAAFDQVDKSVDARYVRGAKLLMDDPKLGGLVRLVRYIGRKWEFEKGELDTVALVVTYEVEFSTNRRDPSVAGF